MFIKLILGFLIVFTISLQVCVAREIKDAASGAIKINEHGEYESNIDSFKPEISFVLGKIKFINCEVDLTKLKPYDIDDLSDQQEEQQKKLINAFTKAGFDPGDNDGQGGAAYCVSQIKVDQTNDLNPFCVCGKFFIVNPKNNKQAVFLVESDTCGCLENVETKEIDSNMFRVLVTYGHNGVGKGASIEDATVMDFDFGKGTVKQYLFNGNSSFDYLYGDQIDLGMFEQWNQKTNNVVDPKEYKEYISSAARLIRIGKFDQAVDFYKKALLVNSADERVFNNLGYAYIRLGKPKLAIPALKSAVSLNPNFAYAHCVLALGYWNSTYSFRMEKKNPQPAPNPRKWAVDELLLGLKLDPSCIDKIKHDPTFKSILQSKEFIAASNH